MLTTGSLCYTVIGRTPCPLCAGEEPDKGCPQCNGTGYIETQEEVDLGEEWDFSDYSFLVSGGTEIKF